MGNKSDDWIIVKGARSHNLKNIDVEIPKHKLVTITGVSGSGKSSLAFDTIYAEGQRRYVESLSAYARQFLGVMEKPDVDYIEGLSPAISIDQKSSGHNPRSTVGTVTEIYDYLRLLFARAGHPHSPTTGKRLQSQTIQEIVDTIFDLPKKYSAELEKVGRESLRALILAPVVKNRKGTYEELFGRFLAQGYTRVRVDGEVYSLEEDIKLEKQQKHNIELVVDRVALSKIKEEDKDETDTNKPDKELQKRITDSIELATNLADGELLVELPDLEQIEFYSENLVDPETGESFPKIEPHSFSFNSPFGACPNCNGLGTIKDIEPELIYNPKLSVTEGGIFPWAKVAENTDSWNLQILKAVAKAEDFDLRVPLGQLKESERELIFFGGGSKKYEFEYTRQMDGQKSSYKRKFEGVIPNLLRRYHETESDYIRSSIEQYMREKKCPVCDGRRLNPISLAVTITGLNIQQVGELSVADFLAWSTGLHEETEIVFSDAANFELKAGDNLTSQEREIANQVLKEIKVRTEFLVAVGLQYLTLNRTARTLSGGESQRIRLASQIGTGLTGVLYVLDEPSIGLHQDDNQRLLDSLKNLRDIGNSVLVVEHDEDTIRQSDYVVDIGPGAGEHGGNVIASGKVDDFLQAKESLTAAYLRGDRQIDLEEIAKDVESLLNRTALETEESKLRSRLRGKDFSGDKITLTGARQNNLKNVTVEFPLQKFTAVTGVSGSGKSSLINEVLLAALHKQLYKTSSRELGDFDSIEGVDKIDKLVEIDQSPIGRTPRSNPATYTGVFTQIRDLFAATREAKARGYKAGRFSFNTKGGRCENCRGDGVLKIEMQFLPDVYVTCDVCDGNRYNRETLQIDYKGKNIAEVLEMTVSEAVTFFDSINSIRTKLSTLQDVGLDYIRLGQAATTLSGGEAQRVKLATELSKRSTGNTMFILDEPTTGLHFEDVRKLLIVLHSLVARGNTVLVIEHNLDLIKTADWIIDLGPAGGSGGGEVIAAGTPLELAESKTSVTGKWLKKLLK